MKITYEAHDGTRFSSRAACLSHERRIARRVSVPLWLVKEALRQATPYLILAKERRWLAEQLKRHVPKT